MDIAPEELQKVSYLDVSVIGDRTVNLMPLWEGGRWHLWRPSANGLIDLKPTAALETDYVSKAAAHVSDVVIPFIETMWQHASWPEICGHITSISADFHNLSTSVEKIAHFFECRQALGHGSIQFVKTELEYMFMLSRSVFDLLQEVIQRLWAKRVKLNDPDADALRKRHQLHPTFSRMILKEKRDIRSVEDLVTQHALPSTLAEAYVAAAPFFVAVRNLRDTIVHSGTDIRLIYVTERGFCIQKGLPALDRFGCWRPEHDENEHIVSLLPLIAHVVLGTIETCNNLMDAFSREITLAPPLAPGYRVFVRGPHNAALQWMQRVADGGSPWWSERGEGAA